MKYSEYNLNKPASVMSQWKETELNRSSTAHLLYFKNHQSDAERKQPETFHFHLAPSDLSVHSQHGMLEKPSVSWFLKPSASEGVRWETKHFKFRRAAAAKRPKAKDSLWAVKDEFNIWGNTPRFFSTN